MSDRTRKRCGMRVAIIVPRYGPDVLGGAETQARRFAEEAVRRGWYVEIWTTRARDQFTWDNVYPEGVEAMQGVVVHRFAVACHDLGRYAELDIQVVRRGYLSVADQYTWLESGPHSPDLYRYAARHAVDFDVVIALPYTVTLVHYAAWVARERVVVWPCLHDEQYAYMESVRLLLESVWGVMFNSPEEAELAIRHMGMHPRRHAVLGEGVVLALSEDVIIEEPPQPRVLLDVGRLEEGKNLELLYRYVQRYAAMDEDVRLVVLGKGPLEPPEHPAFDYRGFVSEEEKAAAYAAALVLCQPSVNESFSLTVMESWLASRPVLVNASCAVTRGHVQRSKGGLWFGAYEEFVNAITWLRAHATLADRMGQNGRRYVLSNYTTPAVVARFEALIRRWKETDA